MSMRPAALRALIWFWGTAAGIGVAGAATLDVMGPPAPAPESALAAQLALPPAAAPVASLSAPDAVKALASKPAHHHRVRLAEALPKPPIPPLAAHRAPAIRVRPRVVTVAAAAPPAAYAYAPPAYGWSGYYAPSEYAPGYAPGWSGYSAPRSYPYGYYARY
jgi:hypothetical protein